MQEVKMKKVSKIITKTSVTVNFDGKTFTFSANSPEYSQIINCLKEGREDDLIRIADRASRLVEQGNKTTNSVFHYKNGKLLVKDIEVHGLLAEHMIHYMNNGLSLVPLINFFEKALRNPSERVRTDLYAFLVSNDHPITESGNFIAYKRVLPPDASGRMLDIFSKTIDNRPGTTVKIDRSKVDPNPNVTCSYGLHVANWDYAHNHYGEKGQPIVEVEVNPEHVVAIPIDHGRSKIRVCEYFVRGIVKNPGKTKIVPSAVDRTEEKNVTEEKSDKKDAFNKIIEKELWPVWKKASTKNLRRLEVRIEKVLWYNKSLKYRGHNYTTEESKEKQGKINYNKMWGF
jgi:hypothetical protein